MSAGPPPAKAADEKLLRVAAAARDLRPGWPPHPYKRLNFFEAGDVALFSQRDREVAEVATLVEDVSTRIVLLHGLSGVGKSSFLRAGLVPLLSMPDRDVPFFLLRKDSGAGEPIFLRATDDPLGQVHAAMLELAEADLRISAAVSSEMRAELLPSDGLREDIDRQILGAGVTRAISRLQRRLPGSLLLIIDQAEEVITLAQSGDPQNRAAAFFAWLEDIVRERLDMRLIVTLRTEYVGQFCARLAMHPTRTVTAAVNARAGLEDYLLNPVNDEAQLVGIILRPTRKEPVGDFPPPFNTYGFTFEQGLAEQIARDCLRQARGTSALALVQVVCADLYDAARRRVNLRGGGPIVITSGDYQGRGVDVALDSHIDAGIVHAVDPRESPHVSPDQIECWREVLAGLIARDEGGAVRTQMLPREALRETAIQLRLGTDPAAVLERMAGQQWRLLRRAPGRPEADPGFSLGHDAIAGALAKWQDAEKPRREARRSRRRAGWAVVTAVGVIVLSLTSVGSWMVLSTKATMGRLNAAAELTRTELRLPLLLSAKSLDEARTAPFFAKHFIRGQQEVTRRILIDILLDAPVLGDTFAAVGYDAPRRRLATLSRREGRQILRVLSLDAIDAVPTIVLDEVWAPPEKPPVSPLALGILVPEGGGSPVVALYDDQTLRMWPLPAAPGDGGPIPPAPELPVTLVTWPGARLQAQVPDVRKLPLPQDFVANLTWPPTAEMDAGRMHFLSWISRGDVASLGLLRLHLNPWQGTSPLFSPVPVGQYLLAWDPSDRHRNTRTPVIDERCGGRYGFFGRISNKADDAGTLVAYHAGFGASEATETALGEAGANHVRDRTAWSVAFTPDCRYLVARDTAASVRVVRLPARDGPAGGNLLANVTRPHITVPSALGLVVAPGYALAPPFLASAAVPATDGAETLRTTWLLPSGVAMVEATFVSDDRAELSATRLLRAELAGSASWGRLAFSDDGQILFAERRDGFAGAVQLRVFDLRREQRRAQLSALTDPALHAQACDTARFAEGPGNQMTHGERLAWLNERPIHRNEYANLGQPCAEYPR